ncbi:MAG TPA: ABC transporter permease [Candidatus Aquicultor sp.]|jgi:ABC-2 type transport system permease protein
MDTIYILWLRQVKRYFRSRSRIVGALGQPLLFLFALGYGFGAIFQKAGQGNYIQFLVPGIIAMTILFTSMFNGIEVIWDKQFGFLKETLVAPVSRFNIMIGRTIGGATVGVFQGIFVLLVSFIAGFKVNGVPDVLIAIGFMLLLAIVFTALGTAIASVLEDMQGFQLIMNFLIQPLFFLSGALFPLAGLPAALVLITNINPLSYGVDAIRGALVNVSHFGLGVDFLVLGITALVFVVAGGLLFQRVQA